MESEFERYKRARLAARRPSRNNSYTIRTYNEEGICINCFVKHESFHGHGYTLEYILKPEGLIMVLLRDHDIIPYVTINKHTERWIRSQRRELLEK